MASSIVFHCQKAVPNSMIPRIARKRAGAISAASIAAVPLSQPLAEFFRRIAWVTLLCANPRRFGEQRRKCEACPREDRTKALARLDRDIYEDPGIDICGARIRPGRRTWGDSRIIVASARGLDAGSHRRARAA